MITTTQFLSLTDTDSQISIERFAMNCFGPAVYYSSEDLADYSIHACLSKSLDRVFIAEICDYRNNRAYVILDRDWKQAYINESERVGVKWDDAFEGVKFVELETDDDFMKKAQAIVAGKPYSKKVDTVFSINAGLKSAIQQKANAAGSTVDLYIENIIKDALANE